MTNLIELPVKPVLLDNGFRVLETETHYVEIWRMIYNWRVVTVPKDNPLVSDRGWCYEGSDALALRIAVLAVLAWHKEGIRADTEPKGWLKNLQTGQYGARRSLSLAQVP